jgi:hypothetical protein
MFFLIPFFSEFGVIRLPKPIVVIGLSVPCICYTGYVANNMLNQYYNIHKLF